MLRRRETDWFILIQKLFIEIVCFAVKNVCLLDNIAFQRGINFAVVSPLKRSVNEWQTKPR